jgi:hypothetical protein
VIRMGVCSIERSIARRWLDRLENTQEKHGFLIDRVNSGYDEFGTENDEDSSGA